MTTITRIDPPTDEIARLLAAGYRIADKREVVLSFVWSRAGRGTEYVFELRDGE
jgi:hypothetical protein